MTPDQATEFAARITAAMPTQQSTAPVRLPLDVIAADRERVASDLAGLQECWDWSEPFDPGVVAEQADHYCRYLDGLTRTAALYGEKP